MDQYKGLSGGFKQQQALSTDVSSMQSTATAGPPVPVPQSDLAKRMPTLLTYLLSPSPPGWLKSTQPTKRQQPSQTDNGSSESSESNGVQQLVQGIQNMSTGHRLRTINKTIRRDRKIISTRLYNNCSNNFTANENNGQKYILERSANIPIINRRRNILNRYYHARATAMTCREIEPKPMLEPAERRNLIHNNNNMVYTPSLMNIPEYPESILSSYTFANDGTDTNMEK